MTTTTETKTDKTNLTPANQVEQLVIRKFKIKPVYIEAIQFTKEMAEGNSPLPDGVKMRSRETKNGKFPDYMKEHWPNYEGFHKHTLNSCRIEIGDWVLRKGKYNLILTDEMIKKDYTEIGV